MAKQYVDLITSLRKDRGFSQLEIAKKLDISRSSYIAFEQGKRELTLAEADDLGKIFDISLEEIKTGKLSTPEVIIEKSKKNKVKILGNEVWERISIPQEKAEKFKDDQERISFLFELYKKYTK